jgi:ATP:corrinoid adenosyltransferase
MAEPTIRDKTGKFTKGVSGNPTGRKPIPPEIKEALTALVPRAIERLTGIINESEDDKLVMDAVKVVLDRVYGKPAQALDIESNNNHTLEVVLTGQLKEWAK